MGFLSGKKLTMVIPHCLTFAEVQNRLNEYLFKGLKDVFSGIQLTNLRQGWKDNFTGTFSCKVDGHEVTAKMKFGSGQVTIEVQLPFGASTKIDIDSTEQTLKVSLTEMLS